MMTHSLLLLSLLTAAPEPEEAPGHRLSLYGHSGAVVFLSEARTQGGLGGGFGVRDTVDGRWLLQADASGLTGLGSVLALRVGAGVQRRGTWAPAALLSLTGLFGDRLGFLDSTRPSLVEGPAVGVGLTLAPLRFSVGSAQVSALELGVGVGTDWHGPGLLYGLTLLQVGVVL